MKTRAFVALFGLAVVLFFTGCARPEGLSFESPGEGLLVRLEIDPAYEKITITLRNVSDHPIVVLDELTRKSVVWNGYGPTEVYAVDGQGRVLTHIKGMPTWWLAASVRESQGAVYPDDYMRLAPGKELTGTFSLEYELSYLCGDADFDTWKRDKVFKFRVWGTYGLDKAKLDETKTDQIKAESCWIEGKRLQRTKLRAP